MFPLEQVEVKRQLPPLPHEVLEQHFMSVGRPGQALEMYFPPALVQLEVEMQVPGAPPAPVQGPFRVAACTPLRERMA